MTRDFVMVLRTDRVTTAARVQVLTRLVFSFIPSAVATIRKERLS